MNIRQATTGDISEMEKILRALRLPIRGLNWHRRNTIRDAILDKKYFVALSQGIIVGCISFAVRTVTNKFLHIETLAISRDARKRGVGKKLIRFAKQQARKRGAKKLVAHSFEKYDARPFYRSVGFKQTNWGTHNGHKYLIFELEL